MRHAKFTYNCIIVLSYISRTETQYLYIYINITVRKLQFRVVILYSIVVNVPVDVSEVILIEPGMIFSIPKLNPKK